MKNCNLLFINQHFPISGGESAYPPNHHLHENPTGNEIYYYSPMLRSCRRVCSVNFTTMTSSASRGSSTADGCGCALLLLQVPGFESLEGQADSLGDVVVEDELLLQVVAHHVREVDVPVRLKVVHLGQHRESHHFRPVLHLDTHTKRHVSSSKKGKISLLT